MTDAKPTMRPRPMTHAVSSRLSGLIYLGLCGVVVFAPIPLGSARPLAWDILAIIVALLLCAVLFLPSREVSVAREKLAGPTLLFWITIVFAMVQALPWAPSNLGNSVWNLAADALGSPTAASIAADRFTAWTYILRCLSYAGIFYLAVVTGRDPWRAQQAVVIVALSGSVYAAYGLLVYWSGNQTVLWFPKWAYIHDVTGTFVNRNSFATYLGLGTLAAFALSLESFARIDLRGDPRRKIMAAIEFVTNRVALLLMCFVLVTALLLTHSRGGLGASIGGAFVLLLTIAVAPCAGHLRRVGAWSIGPFLLVLTLAIIISGGATLDRFLTDMDSNTRVTFDQLIVQAIGDYPLVGIGLGSFGSIFPIYRTGAIPVYLDLAHNDYLQNVLELGIPAALALFAAIGFLLTVCMRGVRTRQRDVIFPCLGLAATALVGLHAAVDFSLQIPAVTVVYLFLLGIAVAQSISSRSVAVGSPSDH